MSNPPTKPDSPLDSLAEVFSTAQVSFDSLLPQTPASLLEAFNKALTKGLTPVTEHRARHGLPPLVEAVKPAWTPSYDLNPSVPVQFWVNSSAPGGFRPSTTPTTPRRVVNLAHLSKKTASSLELKLQDTQSRLEREIANAAATGKQPTLALHVDTLVRDVRALTAGAGTWEDVALDSKGLSPGHVMFAMEQGRLLHVAMQFLVANEPRGNRARALEVVSILAECVPDTMVIAAVEFAHELLEARWGAASAPAAIFNRVRAASSVYAKLEAAGVRTNPTTGAFLPWGSAAPEPSPTTGKGLALPPVLIEANTQLPPEVHEAVRAAEAKMRGFYRDNATKVQRAVATLKHMQAQLTSQAEVNHKLGLRVTELTQALEDTRALVNATKDRATALEEQNKVLAARVAELERSFAGELRSTRTVRKVVPLEP